MKKKKEKEEAPPADAVKMVTIGVTTDLTGATLPGAALIPTEPGLCGISYLFNTGPSEFFRAQCSVHDLAYTSGSPEQQNSTRDEVDAAFLASMIIASKGDVGLLARAHLYHAIVRTVGGLFWEKRVKIIQETESKKKREPDKE